MKAVHCPGPGTADSGYLNLVLVDLNCAVPVELILRMMLWLFDTDFMFGSMMGWLISYSPGPGLYFYLA